MHEIVDTRFLDKEIEIMSCCKSAIVLKTAIIKKCKKQDLDPKKAKKDQVWCLYSKKSGKVLGRHSSEKGAKGQEAAIQIHKHGSVLNKISAKLRKLAYFDLHTEYAEDCDAELGDQMYSIQDTYGSSIYICARNEKEAVQVAIMIAKKYPNQVMIEDDGDEKYITVFVERGEYDSESLGDFRLANVEKTTRQKG